MPKTAFACVLSLGLAKLFASFSTCSASLWKPRRM